MNIISDYIESMSLILEKTKKHAGSDVIYHCLYGYFFLKKSKAELSRIYNKHHCTIAKWIATYLEHGYHKRITSDKVFRKFDMEKRKWLTDLYDNNPMVYLDEAKGLFQNKFNIQISVSSICIILHREGYTWKKIERRAIQIRERDIIHFFNEISCIPWDYSSLLFLDEVSFDNLGMLRNKGYGVRGERIYHVGEYVRKPRISLLCFLGQTGVQESFRTEGTFTRKIFFDCCRQVALGGKVQQYPGRHSIWIFDGAQIHCDPNIIKYLRSLGIIPIFLPAYCPFYNPIEIMFASCKKTLKRNYNEKGKNLEVFVAKTLRQYENFNATNIFKKCGYKENNKFDPTVSFK